MCTMIGDKLAENLTQVAGSEIHRANHYKYISGSDWRKSLQQLFLGEIHCANHCTIAIYYNIAID